MAELQESGKIQNLALTNFDPEHLQIIVDNDIKIVSNQVQFSPVTVALKFKRVSFAKNTILNSLPTARSAVVYCRRNTFDSPNREEG